MREVLGRELRPGDIVELPCRVTAVELGELNQSVDLEPVSTRTIAADRQTVHVSFGDTAQFKVVNETTG